MRLLPHHNFRLDLLPNGQLVLNADASEISIEAALCERLRRAFERGPGHGLLLLGVDETGTVLPSVFSYWREFAARYVTTLCTQQEGDESLQKVRVTPPDNESLNPQRTRHHP